MARVGARHPVAPLGASLNYLLSSHVWRQDHNGFSHQDPGFIDLVVNKQASVIRVYLPPDANCLLSVADHCLRSRDYVNVIVAGKQPQHDWLTPDEAMVHCTRGVGVWEFASNDAGSVPDVVMACCGDVPTLETLAAVDLLRRHLPDLRVRVVNVVDLMRLQPESEHPHGMTDREFDTIFTDRPAGDLRLPRLSLAHPPPDLPPHQPRQPPCPRVQGAGHDHHALRHGHAQRPRPVPPRHRRARPGPGPRGAVRRPCASRWSTPGSRPAATPASTARTPRDRRVALAGLTPGAEDDGYVLRRAGTGRGVGPREQLLPPPGVRGRARAVPWTPVLHRRALLNLGLERGGARAAIPPDRVAASVAAAKRLRAGPRRSHGPRWSWPWPPPRLRDATNSAEVVERLERVVGTTVRVLDGEEEARLCFIGQRAGVWIGAGTVARAGPRGREPRSRGGRRPTTWRWPRARAVGPARLRGELGTGDPLSVADRSPIRARTAEAMAPGRAAPSAGYRGWPTGRS